jgi:chromosome transmission fidelity protein 1
VLFVGGTLQPFDLFLRQVAPLAAPERVHTFACGHVVPPENVVAVTLRAGAVDRTRPLRFTHEERVARGAALAEEARRIIANVAEVAPDGVVVFFTSYAAEKEVMDGEFAAHLTRLAGKRVFRESRGGAAHATLAQYEEAIRSRNGRGALLSAVMGGKLSEGINFADALARCVIVVGLPYPNPQ